MIGTPAFIRVYIWRQKRIRSTSSTLPPPKRVRNSANTSWVVLVRLMSIGVTPLLNNCVATASGEAASTWPLTASPRWLRPRY
jgi:hypothetical protein